MRLDVFSLTGNMIANVAGGEMEPGDYTFTWTPGPSVGSGIYFYRLELKKPGFALPAVYTKKCVLIK